MKKSANRKRTLATVAEVEERLRDLARRGYPLRPWTLEMAEDYGLFIANPQPSDEEVDRILAGVEKKDIVR